MVELAGRSPSRRSQRTAHRRRQEALHLTWVTASTGRPRKRRKGTHDDQAYDSWQTSFLEPGSWPHKSTAIVIISRGRPHLSWPLQRALTTGRAASRSNFPVSRIRETSRCSDVVISRKNLVGASEFEPQTFWSRTKHNSIDSVSFNKSLFVLFEDLVGPKHGPKNSRSPTKTRWKL